MDAIIQAMAEFVNWLCYLPICEPIFNLIGGLLNIAPETVTRYVARAFERNFYDALPIWAGCIVLPIIILILLKILGFLNPGNLPGKGKLPKQDSTLEGKHIIFLGSSVTKGMAAQGRSFVDMLADSYGVKAYKEAVSGTTLVESGSKSYIARLQAIDPKAPCDLFVCQLSTNDATKKKTLGTVTEGKNKSDFDTKTVCGAIEYIIAYVKETWNCPVVFYTNPEYPSPAYSDMVEALKKIARKWQVQVIDLWSDREINDKAHKKYTYMNDKIHPTKKGYALWTPIFADALAAVIAGDPVPARAKKEPAPKKETLKKRKTRRLVLRIVAILMAVLLLFVAFLATAGIIHIIQMFGFNHPGNGPEYALSQVEVLEDSPLKGMKALGVGSSVLAGTASKGVGPGEYFCALNGMEYTKECAVGTSVTSTTRPTLDGLGTYLPRMMQHTAEEDFDMVFVQLGTNDCADWVVVGEPGEEASLDLADYDEYTYCGAMQSMIAYAINTWGEDTSVFIFSNTRFEDKNVDKYDQMVTMTQEICDKWEQAGYNVYLIDMWNDAELNDVPADLVDLYGAGEIHPRQAGYLVWWMPFWNEVIWPLYQ